MKLAQMELWRSLLQAGLNDDGSLWDWTALGTTWSTPQLAERPIQAQVIAKSHGIWAGASLVKALGSFSGILRAENLCAQGVAFQPGTPLVQIEGTAEELLALERPFLNLAAYVSGIATRTHAFQSLLKQAAQQANLQAPPRLTLTRKTLPQYRDVALIGVLAGGGHPHRVSLSGGVLIKENHIAAAGSLERAVQGVRAVAPHGLKVEVEVRNLEELNQALHARVDGVLLDNFTPEQVASALRHISDSCKNTETYRSGACGTGASGNDAGKRAQTPAPDLTPPALRPFVEVSGGLNEATIAAYVQPGVDVLSVGSLTHHVQSVDLSLLVEPCRK